MNIFCGSLPFSLSEDELKAYFEAYGEVSSVKIINDKFSGKSKGFGFVEMPDDAQAQAAIDGLNGSEMAGRSVVINKSEDKRDSRSGGGGGGYRGGGSGGGGGYRGGGSGGGGGYRGGGSGGGGGYRGGGNSGGGGGGYRGGGNSGGGGYKRSGGDDYDKNWQ